MLYDLNIVWTPQTAQTELERTLRFSKALGYDVVALNHILEAPISAQATNPIPQAGPVHPSFPPAKDNKSSTTTTTSSSSSPSSRRDLPIVLRRATILVSDPSTNHRLPHLAQSYSLLAARPTTDKAFAALTTGTSYPEIALISLDLSVSQPFRFRPKPCMAAVSRGVLFEVCYGQLTNNNNNNNHGGSAMLASTDPQQRARANFIANMMELVRATKGRGIVISSECRLGTATSAAAAGWNLRAPADLVNLFACWGLGPERGLEALGANPRAVVVNEGLRRRSYRGVVDIVDAEGRIPSLTANKQTVTMTTETDSEISDKHGAKKKKNHNNNNKSQQQGQNNAAQQGGGGANAKRKLDGQGTGGGGEQQDTKGQSLPVMSKRHTKKMKLAAER